MRDTFSEAFKRIWAGEADNDAFNRLIIGAGLDWREVAMLRGYARYLTDPLRHVPGLHRSTLANYPAITQTLVELFRLRFDPAQQPSNLNCLARLTSTWKALPASMTTSCCAVYGLIEPLRTNYYQKTGDGRFKDYIAYKLEPSKVTGMPNRVRPTVFVCSPRVEGVHLRGGKVARGGLRWSDRLEDFRTEVLGLVKAQQVKNAVIVPVGAKGGFVCKRMPENAAKPSRKKASRATKSSFARCWMSPIISWVARWYRRKTWCAMTMTTPTCRCRR